MIDKHEREILSIIRYLPVVIILILSTFITLFLYNENIVRFEKESKKLEKSFIDSNKEIIKFQVHNIKEHIDYVKNQKITTLKKDLKAHVDNAYNIINSIYKNNLHKSEEEVIKLIKNALREIRFNNGRGYYFIYDMKGKNILHPILTHLENKDLWDYQDKKGTYILQDMSRILRKKDQTYYSWYWTKPNDENKQYEKLGLFKLFKPFDIFIGTGEYIYDFETTLKHKILEEVNHFKYSKDGYVFIISYDGTLLSYHKKEKIGNNIRVLNDVNNPEYFLQQLEDATKNSDGFVSYKHKDKPKPNQNFTHKTSYIELIDEWGWYIGSGFYMDDFYKELETKKERLSIDNKKSVEKIIIVSISVTILILLVFFYISSLLEKKFLNYRTNIQKQIDDNIKKDNLLAHQSKMASMGEMIGNIAHQWRQPLSAISTIATGLKMQKEIGNNDDKIVYEGFDNINKQVQYLSSTIDDFRSFFKPENKAEIFTINSLIDKTLGLVDAQFRSKDISIIKDIEDCTIYSLQNELVQVLINILNNARDELINKKYQRYIFINTKCKENSITIEIIDNAGGIKDQIINRIFEPYFTTKHQKQGTGIGLFMCEEIIVKHLNGMLIVENIESNYDNKMYKGAKFIIELPKILEITK